MVMLADSRTVLNVWKNYFSHVLNVHGVIIWDWYAYRWTIKSGAYFLDWICYWKVINWHSFIKFWQNILTSINLLSCFEKRVNCQSSWRNLLFYLLIKKWYSSYRGISFLLTSHRTLFNILLSKLRPYVK